MRILMLGWEFPPKISGGLGTACNGMARALVQKGHQVTFLMPAAEESEPIPGLRIRSASGTGITGSLRKCLEDIRHKHRPDEFRRFFIPEDIITKGIVETLYFHGGYGEDLQEEVNKFSEAASAVLLDECRNRRPDVIHAHDWMTYPAAVLASRLTGIPLVAHIHATEYDRCGDHGFDKIYNMERRGLGAADRVIAVSQRTKQIVTERYHIMPDKIDVVYNGISPSSELPPLSLPDSVRDEKRVLFLGRVTYQKCPESFVEAAKLVLDEMPDVRFIMAGNGDLLNSMIERVAELRIGSRFHFTGFVRGDAVRRLYAISSLYVMPSVSEPFGIAPLEAIQQGTPVLLSRQSGCAEVLPLAQTVDFWDVRAMADRILELLRSPRAAEENLRACRESLLSLTWERAADSILSTYGRLALRI